MSRRSYDGGYGLIFIIIIPISLILAILKGIIIGLAIAAILYVVYELIKSIFTLNLYKFILCNIILFPFTYPIAYMLFEKPYPNPYYDPNLPLNGHEFIYESRDIYMFYIYYAVAIFAFIGLYVYSYFYNNNKKVEQFTDKIFHIFDVIQEAHPLLQVAIYIWIHCYWSNFILHCKIV